MWQKMIFRKILLVVALATPLVVAQSRTDPDEFDDYEPQQIHLTIGSDAVSASINFATNEQASKTLARYWNEAAGETPDTVKPIQGRQFYFDEPGSLDRYQYLHTVTLSALASNTTYHYQVGTQTKKIVYWSDTFSFHTVRDGDAIDILAFGDLGLENPVALDAMIDDHKKRDYDFALFVGDMAYDLDSDNGTVGDAYLNMVQPLFANIPFQPAAGNHEQNKGYAHYINRFSNIPATTWENNLQWSFDYKYLHIIIINNEFYFHNHTDEEHDPNCFDDLARAHSWLEKELKMAQEHRDRTPWIIVMTHRPLYCSNYDNPQLNQTVCGEATDRVRNGVEISGQREYGLEKLLKKYEVDLYLCGHKHDYERTYPIFDGRSFSKDYESPSAIVQILFGNAGNYEGPSSFADSLQPEWSATRYSGYGYSRFLFHSREYLEVFHYGIHPNGTSAGTIDHFTMHKSFPVEHDDDVESPLGLVIFVALLSVAVTASVGIAWFFIEKRRGYIRIEE